MGCFINFVKGNDMFGKGAILYFDKESQKSSILGIILTILYCILYGYFFIYKFIRMNRHLDVNSYDISTYIANDPSINLTKDIFYGAFALEHPETYNFVRDERIYYPKAFFIELSQNQSGWNPERKVEIELVNCTIDKFGEKFKKVYENNTSINNAYCFSRIDETLEGHFSIGHYSYFFIQLFPCKNTTENNNHCKPREEIDIYLNSTFLAMEFEDVELMPNNYKDPVSQRNQDIYFKVGKKFFQEVHIFYQILKIETDKEYFGLGINELENLSEEKYLKYHSTNQMPSLIEDDIYVTGDPFCNITIKLFEQIRTQRRTYSNFFSIWGDVDGFMEFIKILFNVLSFFFIDKSYEIYIANKLFTLKEFIKSKTIIIGKIKKKNTLFKSFINLNSYRKTKTLIFDENTLKKRIELGLTFDYDKQITNKNIFSKISIENKQSKIKIIDNSKLNSNEIENENKNEYNTQNFIRIQKSDEKIIQFEENEKSQETGQYQKYEELIEKNQKEKKQKVKNFDKETNIGDNSNIKKESEVITESFCLYINLLPCCICCKNKKNKFAKYSFFLDKSMKFFAEKMDIFNVFKTLSQCKKFYKKMEIYFSDKMS